MPHLENGEVVHIIFNTLGVYNRLNIFQLFEQSINFVTNRVVEKFVNDNLSIPEMEKILFAVDELTGLIWAAAKMRPSQSTKDMELSSLKKKFKDKKFAAGCSRDTIIEGAEQLGWELNDLLESTIRAMRYGEDVVEEEMKNI